LRMENRELMSEMFIKLDMKKERVKWIITNNK
jgi:hypothetical protein